MRSAYLILFALILVGLWVLARRRRAPGGPGGLEQEKAYALGRQREAESQLDRLVEEAREYAVFHLDPGGRVQTWNPGAVRLFGSSAEAALGSSLARFQPPDEVRAGKLDRDLAVARAQGGLRDEGWLVREDGRRFLASVALTATRDARGQATGYLAVVHDLTERQEAEARLLALRRDLEAQVAARTAEVQENEARIQSFIRHAPAAIAVKGLDGRLLLVNRKAEALIGMCQAATPDACCGKLFPAELSARARAQDEEVLTRRRLVQDEESVRLPDGSVRDFLIQKFPLVDTVGHCWGLGVIATNITERKQAELAHLQRQKLDAIGLLAGGIAHDFNNLLGAMLGNVELARLELGPLEHLRILDDLLGRATGLVAQVLAYAGLGRTQVQPLDLNQQVEELVRPLRASLNGKASLLWEPERALPPMEGDPAQIRQVVANLVINACEALEGGGGVITLRTGTQTLSREAVDGPYQGQALQPGLHLVLEVSDDGPGMPGDVMERIYDPFYTTKEAGRGLGLSVVRGILRSHRGGIRVTSEEARGTTFRLVFPATPHPARPAPGEEDEEELLAFQATGTVLVVDDEDAVRAVAVRTLHKLGLETLEARDGVEALLVFEAAWDRIRLVLMDLTMPRMGGEEAYRELRRAGALAPIILSSGFGQEEALQRFRGMALAGFLQKPYRLKAFVRTIREALEGTCVTAGPRGDPPRELVAWLPEFELGHPLLDAQHKGLVRAFNHLVAATETGGPDRAFALLIEALAAHVGIEDRLLEETAFCGADERRVAHAALLAKFQGLAARIGRGDSVFTPALLNVVEDDLLNHIQLEVLEMARHFRGPGLTGSA